MLKRWFKYVVFGLVVVGVFSARAGSYDDFFVAIANDNAPAIQQLLARGLDPNTVNPQGQVPLFLSLQTGSLKAAEALLQHPDTRVDAANAVGETPLMMAALRGRTAWCEKLLERGAAINRSGWTPLHYAASGPSAETVEWMLAHGADVNAQAPNGNTALMMAARYGPEESVDALLAHRPDLSLRNEQGLTAADFARRAGREALARRLSLN